MDVLVGAEQNAMLILKWILFSKYFKKNKGQVLMNSVTYNLCNLEKLPILFELRFALQQNRNKALLVS